MSHLDFSTLIQTLTEGEAAIKAVPALKTENAELVAMVDDLETLNRTRGDRIAELEAALGAETAARNKAEAERDAATFREADTRSKLETVRSVIAGASSAVAAIEPEPEPKVEAIAEIQPEPAPQSPAEAARPYLGHAHWSKPHDMTWGDFAEGGGETPDWYRPEWHAHQRS